MPFPRQPKNLFDAFDGMKSHFAAMTPSRFRRNRTDIAPMGSGADHHYRNELSFLKIREHVRMGLRDRSDRCDCSTTPDPFQSRLRRRG